MSAPKLPHQTRPLVFPLLALCFGMVLSASCQAAEWTVPELMHLLLLQKTSKASFTEKKYMAILDKPVESSGELFFEAPGKLEKRTLKPHQESMLLDGDKLTLSLQGKRPLSLRLQEHPEMAALVESIRGTLSGDQSALEKNYSIVLTGVQGKWHMVLTPTQKPLAKIVRQIQIEGASADIKGIAFDQADGDRIEMTISRTPTP